MFKADNECISNLSVCTDFSTISVTDWLGALTLVSHVRLAIIFDSIERMLGC